jgi:beta-glucosidase
MAVLSFPDGFLWGAATAAYQIEGSPLADGAGASIWHTFSHTPNTIQHGHTGDTACDHYRRYLEDVALMRDLGLGAYRFSIAWPRIVPGGFGPTNRSGVDYYERLVDALLEARIEPVVTLYHWDLPQRAEDHGGWVNPESAQWYADYAEVVFRALGDRVRTWITFNEPWVSAWLGYGLGVHAPGRSDTAEALVAGHHLLRAHGLAVSRLRELVPGGRIGMTLSVAACLPATPSSADAEAAERYGAFNNDWFIEPIVHGRYPQALVDEFHPFMPEITAADRQVIARPIDFIGLNYYTRHVVSHDQQGFFKARPLRAIGQRTEMDWEVYPAGLYHLLKQFHERYGLPLYVTENGAAFIDPAPDAQGRICDSERLRYLQSHFEMAHRAISEGVDLRGYFVWSLLDNFEWTFGYTKHFGLVHCDFATQKRTMKQSGEWYRRVIEENGL